jgi:hypothetical protein
MLLDREPPLAAKGWVMEQFILEFIGGCWDGMNLHGITVDAVEERLANYVWRVTGRGTEAREVCMPMGYATERGSRRGLRYVVTKRTEVQGESLVRLECLAESRELGSQLAVEAMVPPVILRFEGGTLDGQSFDSRSPNHEESLAVLSCYLVTEKGRAGKECRWLAFRKLMRKGEELPVGRDGRYSVVDRSEGAGQIVVTLRHLDCRI